MRSSLLFFFLTVTHKQNDHLIPLVNKVRTSEGLHHHSRRGSISLLQQTLTNGAIATSLPKLESLNNTLFRDFPGAQSSLDLRSANEGCCQRCTLLACSNQAEIELTPGIALRHRTKWALDTWVYTMCWRSCGALHSFFVLVETVENQSHHWNSAQSQQTRDDDYSQWTWFLI